MLQDRSNVVSMRARQDVGTKVMRNTQPSSVNFGVCAHSQRVQEAELGLASLHTLCVQLGEERCHDGRGLQIDSGTGEDKGARLARGSVMHVDTATQSF